MTKIEMLDARTRARDPTQTMALRRTWRNAADMRLRQLKSQLRTAVIDQDILGLGGGVAQYTPAHARLKSFHEWFSRMANGALDGGWPAPYTAAAWQSGHLAAMRETGKMATLDQFASEHLAQLAQAEFRGIAAALSQQVTRASVKAVMGEARPHRAYADMIKPFEKVAQHRSRTNVNVIAVSAHNGAKLAAYREMGVGRVGVVPESSNVKRMSMRQFVGDGFAYHVHDDRVSKGPGSRVSRTKTPSASTIGRIERTQQDIEEAVGDEVGILTAGDDLVCETCQDIADGGPYSLDEAQGLIPAHGNCRCSFVPSDDRRFARQQNGDAISDAAMLAVPCLAAPRHAEPRRAPPRHAIGVASYWKDDRLVTECVGVLFMAPGGLTLFAQETDSGVWSIPAGKVEPDEEPLNAAMREAAEEVGYPGTAEIELLDRRVVGSIDFRTFFQPTIAPFEPILNDEHVAWVWAPISDPPEPLHPGLAETLQALRQQGFIDYDPNQMRAPAGSPGGGQWAGGGGGHAGRGESVRATVLAHAKAAIKSRGAITTLYERGMEKAKAVVREHSDLAMLGQVLEPNEFDAIVAEHGDISKAWGQAEEDVSREDEPSPADLDIAEAKAFENKGYDIEPIGWKRGPINAQTMSAYGALRDRLIPAIKLVEPVRIDEKRYPVGTVFTGKRGEWHGEVADKRGVMGASTTYGHGGHEEDDESTYERGFVDPHTKTYWHSDDLGIDAAELVEARTERQRVMRELRSDAEIEAILLDWNPDQPREPAGSPEGGQFAGGGAGGGASSSEPSKSAAGFGKKKSKASDFAKAKIEMGFQTPEMVESFISQWDNRIGIEPETFKKQFLGGVDSTMRIEASGRRWGISGKLLDKDGNRIGDYSRIIDWSRKTAESALLEIRNAETGKSVGKQVLAGNIETYKALGIEQVQVHANIDVGGYAWAKYGYVPTASSWRSLSAEIAEKIGGGRASATYQAESWDDIGGDEQEEIERLWTRDTYSEFLDSEVRNWRENGDALDDAKYNLARNFSTTDSWAFDAVQEYLTDHEKVPYTATQILDAISVGEYETGYSGNKDLEFSFDDEKLKEPRDAPPKGQMMLPGFAEADLSSHLTSDVRDDIKKALVTAANDQAEKDADRIDPPEYLSESVAEYQSSYWSDMTDRDKYRWARDNGHIRETPIENDEVEAVETGSEKDVLQTLAASHDPKAIWAIADSPMGKNLLLRTDWNGTLNLNDKEQMDRFNAYVGKKRAA